MAEPTKADADVFYDQTANPIQYHRAAHSVIERGALDDLATPEQAKAAADGWLPVLAKYEIASSASFAEAIAETARKQVSPEQAKAWRAQSAEALKSEYGERAGEVLSDVRKLLAGDAKLRAHLDKTGAGNHPTIVRALAASAAAARKAGKLK
jgi:hypothetical protein